jgi:hypothetical protein
MESLSMSLDSPKNTSSITVPRVAASLKAQAIALHIAGESNLQIARKLGLSKNTIPRILEEAKLPQTSARELPIEKALARAGITRDTVANKMRELLEAKDVRLAAFEGKFTDRVDIPDVNIQAKTVEMAGKMLEMFPREDTNLSTQLFIRIPEVSLSPGHPPTCLCAECRKTWEAIPCETVNPEL